MTAKRTPQKPKSKSDTQGAHPEVQPRRDKSGAPGSESSKGQGAAKDVRNRHDQDGNTEQARR